MADTYTVNSIDPEAGTINLTIDLDGFDPITKDYNQMQSLGVNGDGGNLLGNLYEQPDLESFMANFAIAYREGKAIEESNQQVDPEVEDSIGKPQPIGGG